MIAGELTAQRLDALEFANLTRTAHGSARRRIHALDKRASHRAAAMLLLDPEPLEERMRLKYLLRAIRGVGHSTGRKLLRDAGVRETRLESRLETLTARERQALAAELRRRGEK